MDVSIGSSAVFLLRQRENLVLFLAAVQV